MLHLTFPWHLTLYLRLTYAEHRTQDTNTAHFRTFVIGHFFYFTHIFEVTREHRLLDQIYSTSRIFKHESQYFNFFARFFLSHSK